jgi:hypothetical protein
MLLHRTADSHLNHLLLLFVLLLLLLVLLKTLNLTFLNPDEEACRIVPLTATSAISMGAYCRSSAGERPVHQLQIKIRGTAAKQEALHALLLIQHESTHMA